LPYPLRRLSKTELADRGGKGEKRRFRMQLSTYKSLSYFWYHTAPVRNVPSYRMRYTPPEEYCSLFLRAGQTSHPLNSKSKTENDRTHSRTKGRSGEKENQGEKRGGSLFGRRGQWLVLDQKISPSFGERLGNDGPRTISQRERETAGEPNSINSHRVRRQPPAKTLRIQLRCPWKERHIKERPQGKRALHDGGRNKQSCRMGAALHQPRSRHGRPARC